MIPVPFRRGRHRRPQRRVVIPVAALAGTGMILLGVAVAGGDDTSRTDSDDGSGFSSGPVWSEDTDESTDPARSPSTSAPTTTPPSRSATTLVDPSTAVATKTTPAPGTTPAVTTSKPGRGRGPDKKTP